jgi:F-type H+-transporting ATPase subunit a
MILFIASPLEQFEIITILPLNFLGLNFSVTNSTVFLLLSSVIIVFLLNLSFYKVSLVPASLQSIKEVIYEVTSSMIRDNLGSKGEKFFPFIFTLHLLLLTCNLVGMVPYSFTVTSHIIFTFSLALSIFIGINIVGFKTHGIKFFSLFLPRGVPLFIVPLLVTIEFISYIIKVFTLSIRLFANMTSGHTLLKIIASFA